MKVDITNLAHWVFVISGVVASGLAVVDPKDVPWAVAVISVAQVVHKFADSVQHKATLETAVVQAAQSIIL